MGPLRFEDWSHESQGGWQAEVGDLPAQQFSTRHLHVKTGRLEQFHFVLVEAISVSGVSIGYNEPVDVGCVFIGFVPYRTMQQV